MSIEADTEKTRAILAMQKELQDVTAAVRQVRELLEAQRAEREGWKSALYRLLKESISLLFPEKKSPSPLDKSRNGGNMPPST